VIATLARDDLPTAGFAFAAAAFAAGTFGALESASLSSVSDASDELAKSSDTGLLFVSSSESLQSR